MENAHVSSTKIALQRFAAGGRVFEPGDRFDAEGLPDMDEFKARLFDRQKLTGPLTRESYALAIAWRPEGTVGRGFTIDGLVAMGIVDQPDIDVDDSDFVRRETDEEVGGVLVRARMQGKFPRYSVYSLEGRLLHPKEIGSRDKLMAFIGALHP